MLGDNCKLEAMHSTVTHECIFILWGGGGGTNGQDCDHLGGRGGPGGLIPHPTCVHGCIAPRRGWFSCACSLHASDASAAGHEPGQAWDWVSHLGGGRGHSLVGALHEGGGGMMHHSPAPPEGRGRLSVGRC